MKTLVTALTLLVCSRTYAQDNGIVYFCVGGWSGGGKYVSRQKHWDGAKLDHNSVKFMLKLTKVLAPKTNSTEFDKYNVGLGDIGADLAIPCRDINGYDLYAIDNVITCTQSYMEYRFNLNNMRFLRVNGQGFLDGKDIEANTPSISGGICTKIE